MKKAIVLIFTLELLLLAYPVMGQIFEIDTTYSVGTNPEAIVAADFDNDTDIDIAVGHLSSSGLSLFINDGYSNFQYFNTPFESQVRNLYTADLDDDNDNDIVSCGPSAGGVYVYISLNNGDGSFQPVDSMLIGYLLESICFADFNGDATIDLGLSDGAAAGGIYIAYGNGDGSFQPAVMVYDGSYNHTIVTDDFDGDDDPDLAFSQVYFFVVTLNNGDGSFTDPIIYDSTYSSGPFGALRMITADLDNNSYPDIIAADGSNVPYGGPIISLNNGDGSFQEGFNAWDLFQWENSVCAADFNLDNCIDLASTNDELGWLIIGFNDCSANFDSLEEIATAALNTAICTADFDNDGDFDIAYTSNDNSFTVLSNTTITTGIEEEMPKPLNHHLSQNFPNPFNAITTIRYSIPEYSSVLIEIFNILGQRIDVIGEGEKPAGEYHLIWNANDHPSGIYLYKIKAGDYVETRKMVVLK